MQNAKELGGIAEARFAAQALSMGFAVCKPFIDNRKYDFILERQGRFYRVQVKSTSAPMAKEGLFPVCISYGSDSKKVYTAEDIDLIACYIHAANIFYILPILAVKGVKKVSFYPFSKNSKYEAFRDNWGF